MSYYHQVMKDSPDLFAMLDSSPSDASGRGRPIYEFSPLDYSAPPLVPGASGSVTVTGSNYVVFPWTYLRSGLEKQPVSLEVWTHLARDVPSLIVGKLNYAGLYWDGSMIHLAVIFPSGTVSCSYTINEDSSHHLVGIWTGKSLQLWVDGEMVASKQVSTEQESEKFSSVSDDGNLYIAGASVKAQALAVYNRTLRSEQIARHYTAGRSVGDPHAAAKMHGGIEQRIFAEQSDLFLQIDGEGEDFFSDADHTCKVTDVISNPTSEEHEYESGIWEMAIDINNGGTSIDAITMSYDYDGLLSVETSLDRENWTPHVNHERVAGIDPGYDASGRNFYVRVTFTQDYPAEMRRIKVLGFKSNVVQTGQRSITLPSPVTFYEERPVTEYYKNGLRLSGNVTLGESEPTSAVGFWYYATSGTLNLPAHTAIYENGSLLASPRTILNQWTHLLVCFTPTTGDISFGAAGMIAFVSTYETAPTATQGLEIYRAFVDKPKKTITDPSSISLSFDSSLVYGNTWSPIGG